jgi:hypothetical protein
MTTLRPARLRPVNNTLLRLGLSVEAAEYYATILPHCYCTIRSAALVPLVLRTGYYSSVKWFFLASGPALLLIGAAVVLRSERE